MLSRGMCYPGEVLLGGTVRGVLSGGGVVKGEVLSRGAGAAQMVGAV